MLTAIWLVLGGLAVVLAVRVVADRTGLPAAVLLVLAGLALAAAPLPEARLHPEVILDLVIPPLLFVAARDASLLEIRGSLRLVVSLSVVLVLLTALAVGAGLALVVPGLGLAAALALGAAVAPPDPVAALAIGRRAGLPPRLMTLIEGEGLLNDATALTAYGLAVTAATGGGFSAPQGLGRFVLAVAGGVLAGVLVSRLVAVVLARVDDVAVEIALSLATPFLAYALAETVEGSGVLAVVTAGLTLGHRRGLRGSGAGRLQTAAVWRIVGSLLEGYVFLLIGQQAPEVLDGLDRYAPGTVAAAAAVTLGAVLLVRPLWLAAVRRRTTEGAPLAGVEIAALSWAGTRGVITLATAFALPEGFPGRDLLLLCAYAVVLVTLVGQGLTFAPLLRLLGVRSDADARVRARAEARAAALDAGLRRLDELRDELGLDDATVVPLRDALRLRRERVRAHLEGRADADDVWAPDRETLAEVRLGVLDAEREELVRWRDAGRLADADLRELQRRLDVQELLGGR